MLDVAFARSFFPALASGWAYFDNAGGTVVPRPVIDRVGEYLSRYGVQLGASYGPSAEATERVAAGRAAAARLIGAEPDEVLLGGSTTINTFVLARALAPTLAPGDEVIVTNLDHEANVGAWRRLAEAGAVIREWRLHPDTLALELADLERLLSSRTRLVCFTQCANVVGRIHDAAAAIRLVHGAGAKALVDGVAYAPHRLVDVKALDADFYLVSLYKILGPHVGVLYGKKEHLLAARGVNHFFFGEDELPAKLQPGNVNHELTSALPGILEFLEAIDRHHGGAEGDEPRQRWGRAFELFERHEEALAAPLIDFLAHHPRVRLLGPATAEGRERVAIITFTVPGRHASEIPPLLEGDKIALRWGHFYCHRAMAALGLLEQGGVLRASLAHYNTAEEVERLIRGLERVV
ncbi:MAG TPA: cysteine desulfurase-like protein [Thermoanaerobaculia bacterium]|nr:cysteine desulfurase-like protein [Thermoanaerobaculia bacterium]